MVAIVKPKDAALAEFTKPRDGSCAGVPWHIASPAVHYDLHQVLGVGHFGTCYLATDKRTGETRAIKCLEKSHPEYDPAEVRNEVSVLSRVCNHPNIATLYEVYEDPKHVYLVQEACRGGELFDLIIEKKHFTEADAARAVAVMVSILQHCHECGVLHRDAKPENFLLRETVPEGARFDPANVRAVDFGLSALLEQGSPTEVVGSSYYIAPEVLSGTSYGPPADAWSLGVIAFILISGYPPFWGGSDAAIFDKIQHQDLDMEYEPWNTGTVSKEAVHFVRRLITKDPAKRMTLAEAANHPWLAPATHAAAEVPLPASIVDRLRGFTQENRLTALLMTLVAHHLSDAAIEDLRHTFDRLDTDHDGLVGVADITAALQSAGVDCKSQGIPDLVARLDVGMTHIGQISVDEFLAAALDRKAVFTQSAVNRVFKELDVDGDGKLSVTALAEALAECGVPVPSEVLRRMMDREGALDGRGVVSARSFADLLEVGAEEQGRPAAAAAMDGLPAFGRRGSLDAPIGQQLSLSRLSLGRQVSLTSNGTLSPDLVSPEAAEGSTGRNLDQILRQYSMSGWKTPKRRQGLAMGSVSPTIAKQTLASAASTPSSLASPTIAHLGYD